VPAQAPGTLQWFFSELPYPGDLALGPVKLRLSLAASASCGPLTSEELEFEFVKAPVLFGEVPADSLNLLTSSQSAMAPATITVRAFTAPVMEITPPTTFVVQRDVAGLTQGWETMPGVTVETSPAANGNTQLTAKLPRVSKDPKAEGGTWHYRFATVETVDVPAVYSQAYTIRYFSAQRVAKAAVRKFCKTIPVKFVKKLSRDLGKDTVGLHIQDSWSKHHIEILKSYIEGGATIEQVRTIAYHECGHHLQTTTYAVSTQSAYSAMNRAADRVFGTNHAKPLEHWADCIAKVKEPTVSLGYGGTCTAKQLKAAKRTLHGKRI
jgi:hypothetical protein